MRVPVPRPPPQHMVMRPHWPSVRSLDDLFESFKGVPFASYSIAGDCLRFSSGLHTSPQLAGKVGSRH